MKTDEYLPSWLLGSVLVGIAAADIAFAGLWGNLEGPQMPTWTAFFFVPLMVILAGRERHPFFRAAWVAGAAYLVVAQLPPSSLDRTVLPLVCATICLLMGALFVKGAWGFVGRSTRLSGAATAIVAAGVRIAVLLNWERVLRAHPGAS
jgi:hypothetical protein